MKGILGMKMANKIFNWTSALLSCCVLAGLFTVKNNVRKPRYEYLADTEVDHRIMLRARRDAV